MSSIEEVRAALLQVREHLDDAHRGTRIARDRLAEAHSVLAEADRDHHGTLIPPELARVEDTIARSLDQIGVVVLAIEEFRVRL